MIDFAKYRKTMAVQDVFFPAYRTDELLFHLRASHELRDARVFRKKDLQELKGIFVPQTVRDFLRKEESEDKKTRHIAMLRCNFSKESIEDALLQMPDEDYIIHVIENLDVYPETWVLPLSETLTGVLEHLLYQAGAKDFRVMHYGDVRLNPYRPLRFDKEPLPVDYRKGFPAETTTRIGLCTSRYCNYDMLHKVLPLLTPEFPEETIETETEETPWSE